MTRGTDTSLLAELRSSDPQPVTLIAIETGSSPAWIRYTDHETAITFPTAGGDSYSARPIEVSEVRIDGQDRQAITVVLADVDLELDTWLLTIDFRYRKLVRYLVERDSLDSGAKAVKDIYRIVHHERSDRTITFQGEPLAAILARVVLPARVMMREDFPGIPSEGGIRA